MNEPKRIVNQKAAREYLGISRTLFLKLQEQGVLPGPIPGTKRYDLRALEHSLDRVGGILAQPIAPDYDETVASYERFKAGQLG